MNAPAARLRIALGWALALAASPAAADPGPDTLGTRFEAGFTTDVTNELYYEDAFIDDTFLGTRRVSTPEARVAAVLLATLDGTRRDRATRFQLQNETRFGDKLRRNVTNVLWNEDLAGVWRLSMNPKFEYRDDRTFDRHLEEWRGSVATRLRRSFDEGNTFGDVRVRAEFLRTRGAGADFVPDRNAAQFAAAVDHAPLLGHEWRAGYRVDARQFPDSSFRDHFEHGFEGRVRVSGVGGHWFALDATATRRATMRAAPDSRDQFWQEWVQADIGLRVGETWSLHSRAEVEGFQYDREDSTIYFDYGIVRARIGPRYERLSGWSFGAGPATELLRSPIHPEEDYTEIGGFVEVEYLGSGSWWSASPLLGWREYGDTSSDPDGLDLHGSYAFYELALVGDQRLPAGLRLRAIGSARVELHAETLNDATSLYFSLDVRRLF
jgi:hypothetical protein